MVVFKQDNDELGGQGRGEPVQIDSGAKGQVDTGVFVAADPGRYYIAFAASADLYQGQQLPKSLDVVKPFTASPDAWENNDTKNAARILTSGTAVKPTFMATEDIDWFKVYAPGPGKLIVNLAVPSDIDGVLEVYNPSGKQLLKLDQSMVGEEEFTTVNVPKAGYYYIKTYDYLGNSSVQAYSLAAKFAKW